MGGRNGSELAVLDFAFLERQTFGDADLEHEVLSLFLDQAGRLLPTLQDLSPARQSETAHLIKGSCQGIGADRLADLLQRYGEANGAGRACAHPILTAALADTRAAILARLPPDGAPVHPSEPWLQSPRCEHVPAAPKDPDMAAITFTDSKGIARTIEGEDGATVMEAAIRHNVPEIVAECGGACACATCHVYIDESWTGKVGKPSGMEEDMLDFAYEVKPNSRLSCQIKITPALDGLVVTTPDRQG